MSIPTRTAAVLVASALLAGPWVPAPVVLMTAGAAGDSATVMARTGTTQTASAASTLPTSLVNGDFEYPSLSGVLSSSENWTAITPDGKRFNSSRQWTAIKGFDHAKFGWNSSQIDGTDAEQRAGAVEVQLDQSGNQYAEICAFQAGTAIYQDVDTDNGADVQYHVSLRHASLIDTNIDKMQVLIGAPGHERPVEMTRTKANGHGDREGEKSDVIATKVTNKAEQSESSRNHEGQWETYEATVVVPAGQPVTRFTFKSLSALQWNLGNLVDDITFEKAYPLSYDGNGGTKSDTSTIADKRSESAAVASNPIVNGGFDTPSWDIDRTAGGLPWVYVSPGKGTVRSYWQAVGGQSGSKVDGLSSASFGWHDLDAGSGDESFELHREKDGNTAADVHAGRTVAQTIPTTPGTTYRFSIRHSGRSKGNAGGVMLLTGPDEQHLTPVELTRDTVSATGAKYGDVIGTVGTVAWTHSDSADGTEGSHEPWNHSGDWESYSGTVVIPAGQTETVVAYRGVDKGGQALDSAADSIIDDLRFEVAYPLAYDANGGVKSVASTIADEAEGTAVAITDRSSTLPRELVNGSFQTYGNAIIDRQNGHPPYFGYVAVSDGMVLENPQWGALSGFDPDRFGWRSNDSRDGHDGVVEVQRLETAKKGSTGNVWGEIAAEHQGKYLYQDIDTSNEGDAMYTVQLRHASRVEGRPDSMQVLVGPPGQEQPVTMTRVASGNGDEIGEESTLITSTGTGQADQWNTYTGSVLVPKGQDVTRFTFKSVKDGASKPDGDANGNLIDDVQFTLAYTLDYDANGGNGAVPSRTQPGGTEAAAYKVGNDSTAQVRTVSNVTVDNADGTATRTVTRSDGSIVVRTIADTSAAETVYGGCQVYYPAGAVIDLATAAVDSDCWDSSMLTKQGRNFLGWSEHQSADVTNAAEEQAAAVTTRITMPAGAKTVWAVWAANPVLSYDVNLPDNASATVPVPESQTVQYNSTASDTSGWTTGDTSKVQGYRFDGWYTAPSGGTLYDWTNAVTANTTVYARWASLPAAIHYDANGGQGRYADTQARQMSNVRIPSQIKDDDVFTRADYELTGFNTEPDGSGTAVDLDGDVWVGTEDVTLYCQWKPIMRTIRFDANGGGGAHDDGSIQQNRRYRLPGDLNASFHRLGYRLVGWNTEPDGSGTAIGENESYRIGTEDVTFYAQWQPLLSFLPSAGGDGRAAGGLLPTVAGVASLVLIGTAGVVRFAWRKRAASLPRHGR